MTACAIRYRLDGSGPSAFLVECDGQLRLFTRGVLGGVMPSSRLLAMLAERGCRWVPAQGVVDLDLDPDVRDSAKRPSSPPIPSSLLFDGPHGGSAALG